MSHGDIMQPFAQKMLYKNISQIELLIMIFVLGITVPIDEGFKNKIRVFPLLPKTQTQSRLRSNLTYDEIININENEKPYDQYELRDLMRGHIGPCALRPLKYFDVGTIFLSDTLHNLYHGVMVRTYWQK